MLQLESGLVIRPSPIPLLHWTQLPHAERQVARGLAVRVHSGVYASAALWRALPPWDRYLARVHAVAMIHPDAVFCLESAAVLLGMPIFGDPGAVHILVRPGAASRSVSGVRTHRAGVERDLHVLGGITMTAPLDTAVDLARHRHNAVGLAAADAALRLDRRLTAERLTTVNEARSSSRGRNIARWPLSQATALSETALESISRSAILWLGFPAPELQVTFTTGADEDRSDYFWATLSLIGEADGDIKYDGRFGEPTEVHRRQSARDGRLYRHVRAIAHWGWSDATDVARLRSILRGVGLTQIQPEDSAQLASMTRLLAPRAPHSTRSTERAAPSAREHWADEG